MTIRRFSVAATVDASGDAEVYSPKIFGRIVSIRYVKPGSGGYADGVDFVITNEATGETVWSEENVNASASRYPRAATHSNAGAAALYASGGTAVNDMIAIGGDSLKIVVDAGGNATTGTFHITIDG